MASHNPLTVVDLFCGPGGLSEGFRQTGFTTVFALDYDGAAVETFQANHPDVQVVKADIRDLDPTELPECDLLIGGPPCVEFSTSKAGGNGNILDGLELVQAFLRAIHCVQPRWWVMENVPRITRFLPDEVPLRWIGIEEEGVLAVPQRLILNSADFGAPQARRRFLMGNYPEPVPTHTEQPESPSLLDSTRPCRQPWRTLGQVLNHLPDPGSPKKLSRPVSDPNYDLVLPIKQFTDQFHETGIDNAEAKRLERLKVRHPYMGKMAFPDNTSRPARTVVATQLGRETLVIANSTGDYDYRRPTVREVACLQGFPITYQFFGSASARYRLVGDAVPPYLGRSIGQAILEVSGLSAIRKPLVQQNVGVLPPPLPDLPPGPRKRVYRPDRRFADMVPGKEVRGCRAELDNRGKGPDRIQDPVRWRAVLHVGEGKHRRELTVSPQMALRALSHLCDEERVWMAFDGLIRDLDEALMGNVPEAHVLQLAWTKSTNGTNGPDELVDLVSSIIDGRLPVRAWDQFVCPAAEALPILRPKGIRIRILAGLLAAAQIAEISNRLSEGETPSALMPMWENSGGK